MKEFNVKDERVTYLKQLNNHTSLAFVSDKWFIEEKGGLDTWWDCDLGQQIIDNLYCSGTYQLGVFIYDEEKSDFKGNIVKYFPQNKMENIVKIVKRRFNNCTDGVLALTDCTCCDSIIKIGESLNCLRSSVAGMHICNTCLYS